MKKFFLSIFFLLFLVNTSFANQLNEKHLYVDSEINYKVVNKDNEVLLKNGNFFKVYPGEYKIISKDEEKIIFIGQDSDEVINVKLKGEKESFSAKQIFYLAMAGLVITYLIPKEEKTKVVFE